MAKIKSPPGHEATSLNGLEDELVVFNQRLTRLETKLWLQIDENKKCTSGAAVLAGLAILIVAAHTVHLALEAWS